MTTTRYSALSATVGAATGISLVGGSGAVTDETDLSTYLNWAPVGSSGPATFLIDFGPIPDLLTSDRAELIIVGEGGPGGTNPVYGWTRIIPGTIGDGDPGYGHFIFWPNGPPNISGLEDGVPFGDSPTHSCTPFLPGFSGFDMDPSIGVVFSGDTTFNYGWRIYGIYLNVLSGLEPSGAVAGSPYVSYNMYNGALLTFDSSGEPLAVTGDNPSSGVQTLAAWEDGAIAVARNTFVPFYTLQPAGLSTYAAPVLTGADLVTYIDNSNASNGDVSVIPLESRGTVMACFTDYGDVTHFWEFSKEGLLLNRWTPTIPVHSQTGNPRDNWYPQSGGSFGDTFVFNTASDGNCNGRTQMTSGSGGYGGDVLAMDLVTGLITTIITDGDIGVNAGLGIGDPTYGSPFLGTICLDPDNGDVFMYLADGTYDDLRNDAQYYISRWSITGTFLGKIGFDDGHLGVPYEWNVFVYYGAGGITCCADGRLIYAWSGGAPVPDPDSTNTGDGFDGLMQLDKTLIPTDGSTAYSVPNPFYRVAGGLEEGIAGDVTRMMVEPTPPLVPTPGLPIECRLGCPDYQVIATSRCGQVTVCELDNINSLDYGRVMDDTSEAIIVMNLQGDGLDENCCECVGGLRSWIHSVMIFRDGSLVWGPGPVVNILYQTEQVTVTARDVTAWLDVRLIHNDLDFFDANPLSIAQALINDAMAPNDPCNVAGRVFAQSPPTAPPGIDRSYTSEDPSQYAGDAFRELARTAMDYTTIGDRIILGSPLSFGPYVTLTGEDFLGELEIEERGLEAGTKWVVQGDAVTGAAGGSDPYYGLIEQLADESSIEDEDEAALAARNRLEASNPAPLFINVPDGSRLSPESPVCFEQLVPGTLVNVNMTSLCREVYARLRLTSVKVHVSDSGDEEVGVTLSPLGTTFGEAAPVQ